jgi:hypothetical protein
MAVRRQKAKRARASASARGVGVVVEDLRSQFKVFGEALLGMREQMTSEFAAMPSEFAKVRVEMTLEFAKVRAEMTSEFAKVRAETAAGFARVDREIGLLKTDLGFVKSAVTDHSRDLREIRVELKETKAAVVRVEGALARKVDRDELEAIVQRVHER